MTYSQYRFKFYFNASHAIYLMGQLGESHPHTWELIIHGAKITDDFAPFNEIEKKIEDFLSQYQDVFINTVQPFTTINPTLENICTHFKTSIQELLYLKGWLLLSIELSETPTRAYVISMHDEAESKKSYYEKAGAETNQDVVDELVFEKLDSLFKNGEIADEKDIDGEQK